ncbi:hypothetical protein BHM03_00007804 [Ensete ventricosum]|nr:hypothetical protein BHM03_00007804 [Ensete ventricosum]
MATLLATVIISLLFTTASITTITAGAGEAVIFAFGDSLSDVGNNNYLPFSLAKSDYPWYGIDYYNGRPTGRFTNGRTIGDIISNRVLCHGSAAAKLGVPSSPPYLSLSMNDDAILGGVNYASGGAGILNETGIYFVGHLLRLPQHQLLHVSILNTIVLNLQIQKLSFDDQISCFEKTKRLYKLGARKVVFHGLAPMGCIPSQRATAADGKCLGFVNDYVLQFNSRVKKLLVGLNSKLPGAQMAFADCYNVVLDLINHPEQYGKGRY